MQRRVTFGIVYACSGAAALVYEITWTRLLTLYMGHTVAAASIVLSAFMGGLALGAALAGAPLARRLNAFPLRAYAALEAGIGLTALALPVVLSHATPLLAWAYADASAPVRFGIVRAVVALLLVSVPAAAMGATFPLASTWAGAAGGARAASSASALYALNTAGAALGALTTGFWLLPALGVRAATWTGVALNAIAAGAALYIDRLPGPPAEAPATPPPSGRPGRKRGRAPAAPSPRASRPLVACAAAAVSGFAALGYEVVFTRLIALLIGPTTYAFTTMAVAFIGGMAIGSAGGTWMGRRASRLPVWLGAALVASGVAANAAGWYATSHFLVGVRDAEVGSFGPLMFQRAMSIAAMLLPMSAALGATFTLALQTADDSHSMIGRSAALVYSVNSVAAVAGALAAGFGLVPWLGLQSTLLVLGSVSIAAGTVCWAGPTVVESAGRARVAAGAAAVAGGCGLLLVMLPPWDRDLMASGPYLYAARTALVDRDAALRAGTTNYYREGAAGTVSVRTVAGTRVLSVDGKVDAGTGVDMNSQRIVGLLPILFHPSPADVLVIGLGSGVTASSVVSPGTVRHTDIVEISPEVVAASEWFRDENNDVLRKPGTRLVVNDGRSHLALTDRRYDVIVSEPSNPWMAGVAALFTREYLETVRAHLKPDGIVCQWAQTYQLAPDDLKSIVRTFTSVFPQATLWLVGSGDVIMIGTNGPSILDHFETFSRQSQGDGARATLTRMGIPASATSFALLSLFVGGPAEAYALSRGAPVQTDDRTALEFTAPRALYGAQVVGNNAENLRAIKAMAASAAKPPAVVAAYQRATSEEWSARGRIARDGHDWQTAFDAFKQAAMLDSRNADALAGLAGVAPQLGRRAEALAWFEERASAEPKNAHLAMELALMLSDRGDHARAVALGETAAQLAPDDLKIADAQMKVIVAAKDLPRLSAFADRMISRFPGLPASHYYRAQSLFVQRRADEALAEIRVALAAHPDDARAEQLLGTMCLALQDEDCARTQLTAAMAHDPRDPTPYVRLGELHMRHSDPSTASNYFAQAIYLDERSEAARQGLRDARQALLGAR
jgi:spermidine synthase